MATPNYEINYEDQRFKDVETDKQAALDNIDATYNEMIGSVDAYYNKQIDAAQNWADKQTELQNQKTDLLKEQINQQKAQAQKDYIKEQSGAYVDWQKQSNQYGANAEAMAAQGLAGSGFSESSQVAMYNTYQNRVATARQSYDTAVMNFNNSMKEAQLQNNSALAEIAYNTLQTQLELSLQGFQYKNELIISQTNKKLEVENQYYNRYQDVLAQLNKENALAEEARQFNETLQLEKEQAAATETLTYEELLAALKGEGGYTPPQTPAEASFGTKSAGETVSQIKDRYSEVDTAINNIANTITNGRVTIPGHGDYTWTELLALEKNGLVKEEKQANGKIKYVWVGSAKTENEKTKDAKTEDTHTVELDNEEGGTGESKDDNGAVDYSMFVNASAEGVQIGRYLYTWERIGKMVQDGWLKLKKRKDGKYEYVYIK